MDEFFQIIGDSETEESKFNGVNVAFIKFDKLPKRLSIEAIFKFVQSQSNNLEFFSVIPTEKGNYISFGFSKPELGQILTSLFIMLTKNGLDFTFCPSKQNWLETKLICKKVIQSLSNNDATKQEQKDEEYDDIPMPDEDPSIPISPEFSIEHDLVDEVQKPLKKLEISIEEEASIATETIIDEAKKKDIHLIPEATSNDEKVIIDFWKNTKTASWETKIQKHFIDMSEIEKKLDLFPDHIDVPESSPYSLYKARIKASERQMPVLDENEIFDIISFKSLFDVYLFFTFVKEDKLKFHLLKNKNKFSYK